MKRTTIEKDFIFEQMSVCMKSPNVTLNRRFEDGEFDTEKNIALVNDGKFVVVFQNDNPQEQSDKWEDEFMEFCDLLVEEYQFYTPLEMRELVKVKTPPPVDPDGEADMRVFCGVWEVLGGK